MVTSGYDDKCLGMSEVSESGELWTPGILEVGKCLRTDIKYVHCIQVQHVRYISHADIGSVENVAHEVS